MVQALWRHGSRSISATFKNDYFSNFSWPQGGGGKGQLDTVGMKEHIRLGELLRNRYVDGAPFKFLSDHYRADEVYIRSTDVNRTIVSAMSNMLGMYGEVRYHNRPGIDYPADKYWPEGFIPIPVHAAEIYRDSMYTIACTYLNDLYEAAQSLQPLKDFAEDPLHKKEFQFLSEKTGESINTMNLWRVVDSLKIERAFYPDLLRNVTPWATDEKIELWEEIYRKHMSMFMGVGLEGMKTQGINIQEEMRKLRSGYILNEIFDRFQNKIDCQNKSEGKCQFFRKLKYYAYSTHDLAIYGILVGMGFTDQILELGELPGYASTILLELWQDIKTNEASIRMLYRRNETEPLDTSYSQVLPICNGEEFCKFSVLQKEFNKFRPDRGFEETCWGTINDELLFSGSSSILGGFLLIVIQIMIVLS